MKQSSVVTMARVAAAAGVATSTVSKALREDPTIPVERRREIQRVANELGYRPNPLVAALMAQLHGHRRRNDPHHIAWIDLWSNDQEAARATDFKLMLRGANQRASELGYKIEVHHVAHEGTSPARLHEILISRCQWGLIIPPVPLDATVYPISLEGLSGVTIGTSLHEPVMHRVSSNLFQGSQLACRKLRERGFRRIGLVLSPKMHERVECKWLGAFLAEQTSWPAAERVPPLFADSGGEKQFHAWIRSQKPDAILIAEPEVDGWLDGVRGAPPTVWLRITESTPKRAMAIDTRPEMMGAAAVELVVGQMHRNERGSPKLPNALLLDGVWRD